MKLMTVKTCPIGVNKEMKMSIKVFPYNQGSRGAKALAVALNGRVLLRKGSKYKRREEDLIINWGAVDSPFNGAKVANQPEAIKIAQNKLTCFKVLDEADVRIPEYWTNKNDIPDKAFPIMCRKSLTGQGGAGIIVAENRAQLVDAPLYTKYVKKKEEYRVHVLRHPKRGTLIISQQRKAKRHGAEGDFKIRNLANGFVFVREGVVLPNDVQGQAMAALEASGLAFGAVDVIWNEAQQKAYVLEINTAPGLEGQTVEDYAEAFRNL
jgi:glutathione synthase/RimK-type ligase-like ATP-grasp enzyme